MKLVAVIGTPHGTKGNTGQLLEAVLRGAEQAGAEVRTFSLLDHPIQPCAACDVCHRIGQCATTDDFGIIRDTMVASDGIILASPNFIFSVSAQMKAFMDRCCSPLHCQVLLDKYGAAVVASGGTGSEEVESYLLRFLRAMGTWTVGSIGADASQLANSSTKQRRLLAAADLGRQLVEAIRSKATYPIQAEERRSFFERMRNLIMMRRNDWCYEFEHWKSHGWV